MKAMIWRDETLGAEYDVEEIPAEPKRKRRSITRSSSKPSPKMTIGRSQKFVEGETIAEGEIKAACAATIAMKIFP